MPSYNAQIIPNNNIPNELVREHCSANHSQIASIGRDIGQQVRVMRYASDGVTLLDYALYTVIDVHDQELDVVFLGYAALADLSDRLGLSTNEPFTGKIDSQVTDTSEFTEHLHDNGRHRGLISIAPHGGEIEKYTDQQAERVGQQLATKCVSVWACKGYKPGGGAFARWHITSTDISEESFPQLNTVISRGFKYAIAFHGWDEDSICIGGSAAAALKQEIKTSIQNVVSDIDVFTAEENGCPATFNGDDPKNIVNRLAVHGIQIEQSRAAREKYGNAIAEKVAKVMYSKIQVCAAPVFPPSSSWTCFVSSIHSFLHALLYGQAVSISCEIKRLLFRLRNCRKGNPNPCLEL